MDTFLDRKISILTVRLKDSTSHKTIGSGVIYSNQNLNDTVYILTAAHCLYRDGEALNVPLESVIIDFYNQRESRYSSITIKQIDHNLVSKDIDNDIAVIVLPKKEVENLMGEIPSIKTISRRQSVDFKVKGFPNATNGDELAVISPTWIQEMSDLPKFQLRLDEDYTEWYIEGFSGAGVFLYDSDEIYLHGLFARYREEEKGKVIYCQYAHSANHLLTESFLPELIPDYLGGNNLNHTYFKKHIETAIEHLGPRFTEEINFELPISNLFNDIVRDGTFTYRFLNSFDEWLTKDRIRNIDSKSPIYDILNIQVELQDKIKNWLNNEPFRVPNCIDITWIISELDKIDSLIDKKNAELYELQGQETKKDKVKKNDYSYRPPYTHELEQVRDIQRNNRSLQNNLSTINIELSNKPILLLKGDAGSGKSHLFGDIANNRLKHQLPSILLLGQHFKNSKTVKENIISLLGIDCSFDRFLQSINLIGEQLGTRVPILIDALNEGAGVHLWRDELAGLIKEVLNYPYVGLALSVRTTYYDQLIPKSTTLDITIKEHYGFRGNEYAALKLFCDHYEIKQPDFPILAPEFTKPLFLKLVCLSVQNSIEKIFPTNFQGIESIFEYYTTALDENLFKLRDEYRLATGIIQEAIEQFSIACYRGTHQVMTLKETLTFFRENYSHYPSLLDDLIQEGVFIRNSRENYHTGEKEEYVYFAYERFGDHLIAKELTRNFKNREEIVEAGKECNTLGELINDHHQYNEGILEALAIILPEKFELELYEIYHWFFEQEEEKEDKGHNSKYWKSHFLSKTLLQSLKWRKLDSISDEKLITWFRSGHFNIQQDDYFYFLTEIATVKEHPFNANRLFKILANCAMPDRDSFWQKYMKWYGGYDDDEIAYPLRRLIDWSWTPYISAKIDNETATLAGVTLVWLLSSTNRKLRDETTKALVNLLEQRPESLIAVLEKFSTIDDLYILERLYAVAYGCILRTESIVSIKLIGEYVYIELFEQDNLPQHILLRDYGRNIVEYMVYKNAGSISVDVNKIRPPYKSKYPKFPSKKAIEKYEFKAKKSKEGRNGYINNRVHFSVMEWDFGRYIVESKIRNFSPISFTREKKYKNLLKKISKDQESVINGLVEVIRLKERIEHDKHLYLPHFGGEEKYEEHLEQINSNIKQGYKVLDQLFPKKKKVVKKEIIPYLINKEKINKGQHLHTTLDPRPVKRWIVKRVYELGYDIEKHGEYDRIVTDSHFYADIERIGKKYQWIAFHEIMALLSDHHHIDSESFGKDYDNLKGPWQFYARDVDPAFVVKNPEEKPNDDLKVLQTPKQWYEDVDYNYWNQPSEKWVKNIKDLPLIKDIIAKKDDSGQNWVFLNKYVSWYQPKIIGEEKYNTSRQQVFFKIQAYIINKKDRQSALSFLKKKNFWGNWMPEHGDEINQLFNREKYWSPAYLSDQRKSDWKKVKHKNVTKRFKVLPCSVDAKSNIDGDKSEAEYSYYMPCEFMFNGLKLNYAPQDGEFHDDAGIPIVKNIPHINGMLIQTEALTKFLNENNLDIIWTVMGEKMVTTSGGFGGNYSTPCGVYYIDDNEIKGTLKYYKRD